jgi:hypothetical protein
MKKSSVGGKSKLVISLIEWDNKDSRSNLTFSTREFSRLVVLFGFGIALPPTSPELKIFTGQSELNIEIP